jgi:hypothetical protein
MLWLVSLLLLPSLLLLRSASLMLFIHCCCWLPEVVDIPALAGLPTVTKVLLLLLILLSRPVLAAF